MSLAAIALSTVLAPRPEPAVSLNALMAMEYNTLGHYLLVPLLPGTNLGSASTYQFVLKSTAGEEIQRADGFHQPWPTMPMVDGVQFPIGALNLPTEAGGYSMAVEVDGEVVTSLDFSIEGFRGNGRQFPAQQVYKREGPWRTHAYFSSLVDYPELALYFNWWTGLHESDAPQPCSTSITVLHNGRVVARTDEPAYGWVERKDWSFNRKPLTKPNGDDFAIADLLALEGTLEFVVKHISNEDDFDVRVKSYFATIEGGAFVEPAEMGDAFAPTGQYLTDYTANVRPGSLPNAFPYVRTWWTLTKN